MGIGYIRSTEYEAWARLNRVVISPCELAILKALDRKFVAHHSKNDYAPKSEASRPMTPELFDSLFK